MFLVWSFFGFGYVILRLPQEQTLLLQNKSKGSLLTKLGEVEKHFSILSKKCAMVTQAHEKLQQNGQKAARFGSRNIPNDVSFLMLINYTG